MSSAFENRFKWSLAHSLSAIDSFRRDWWHSRPRGFWMLAATGILSLAAMMAVYVAPRAVRDATVKAYERRAQAAQKEENWSQAELWLQKLIEMGDSRAGIRYQLAMTNAKLGRHLIADAMVQKLVSDVDYPPALAWIAAKSLDDKSTPQQIEKAIEVLKRAADINREDETIGLPLADAYRRLGRTTEAANQLLALSEKKPEYNLPLAILYSSVNQSAAAKKHAILAQRYYEDRAKENPTDESVAVAICDAMLLQGLWEESLRYASRRIATPELLSKTTSKIHAVAAEVLVANQETQLDAISHLILALQADSSNRSVLLRLARLTPFISKFDPKVVDFIRDSLTAANKANPDDWEIATLLGLVHAFPGGELEVAEKLLQVAGKKDSVLLITLADIQRRLLKNKDSDQTLELAVKMLRETTDRSNDNATSALADALSQLKRFQEAADVLKVELTKRESLTLRQALAQVYLRQSSDLTDDKPKKIAVLVESIKASNGNPAAEAALADVAATDSTSKDLVVNSALELVAKGESIRGGHMILGIIYSRAEDWVKAVFHFSHALNDSPNDLAIQNNLAWSLAKRLGPGDEKTALEMAEKLVDLAALNPEVRETRGLCYLINRRWSDAIGDFEFVLKAFPERKNLHKMLSEAYRRMGNDDAAEKHQKLSE